MVKANCCTLLYSVYSLLASGDVIQVRLKFYLQRAVIGRSASVYKHRMKCHGLHMAFESFFQCECAHF